MYSTIEQSTSPDHLPQLDIRMSTDCPCVSQNDVTIFGLKFDDTELQWSNTIKSPLSLYQKSVHIIILYTRKDGRMSWASISNFGRSGYSESRTWSLMESNQWHKNVYLLLPSQALCILRIWLVQLRDIVTEWDITSWCWLPGFPMGQHWTWPWVHTVKGWYSPWYNVARM